jgi:hypothetical protein
MMEWLLTTHPSALVAIGLTALQVVFLWAHHRVCAPTATELELAREQALRLSAESSLSALRAHCDRQAARVVELGILNDQLARNNVSLGDEVTELRQRVNPVRVLKREDFEARERRKQEVARVR